MGLSPAPTPTTSHARAALVGALAAAGYDETNIPARLRVPSVRDVARPLEAHRQVAAMAAVRPNPEGDHLDILVALFLFQIAVESRRAEQSLGTDGLAAAQEMGLIVAQSGLARAPAMLWPSQGRILATDSRGLEAGLNKVMPLFPESHELVALTVRREVDAALDLCTGSGIHAIQAARHARRVVAVDISPRATAFTRFNAWINGVENVDVREGDLFEAVAARERFGLVTANPPYNPEIATAAGDDYHSGGESGEEQLSRIIARMPSILTESGHGHVISLFVDRQREPFEDRMRHWLAGSIQDVDVILMARPMVYRPLILAGLCKEPADRELHRNWKDQGITGFRFGVLTLRITPKGRSPVWAIAPYGDGLTGPKIVDLATALERLSEAPPATRPAVQDAMGLGRAG